MKKGSDQKNEISLDKTIQERTQDEKVNMTKKQKRQDLKKCKFIKCI